MESERLHSKFPVRYSGASPTMSRGKMTLKTTVTMTVVYDELAKSNIAQPKISFLEARLTVAIFHIL
jgi:hypothetical protein